MSMPDEMRRYIEDLQRHIQHRDQEIQRLQWQLQQLAEQLKVAQASGAAAAGSAPDGQTSRQLNDLKRENRDLRIKLLDLENSKGGGDPSALVALQQQNRDLEAALQRAQQHLQQVQQGRPGAPQDSAELDALRRENASLKQQLSRTGAAGGANVGAGSAPRAAFDQVIAVLEQSLGQLRRDRERAPADSIPASSANSGNNEELVGQLRDLERTNRQLERDLERALSGGGGGGNSNNDAELQALRQKFSQAERHIHDLTQANQALEAQVNSGGGGGDAARQLNVLKRENRDLRVALDEARAGGGGGGADMAPLQARIQELESMLRQRGQSGGGGGGGGDPRLRENINSFSTSAEEILGQWRGELRALSDQNQELRKLSELILELPGSARSNLDEVDLGLITETLDEFVQNAQKSIQKLKDQLRPLRDAAS